MEHHHGIDEKSQDEIDQHTTYHDEETLPGRFATELIRLFRLLHLFGIETLVDHTRNLTIATQWQPAHSVSSI